MNIVVIGAGLIGAHIIQKINLDENKVYVIAEQIDIDYLNSLFDISKVQLINSLFDTSIFSQLPLGIDKVYFCAGSLGNNYEKNKEIAILNDMTLMYTMNDLIKEKNVKQIFYISTKTVNEYREKNVSNYTMAKKTIETFLNICASKNEIKLKIIRSCGIVGYTPIHSQNWLSQWIRMVLTDNEIRYSPSKIQQEFRICNIDQLIELIDEPHEAQLVKIVDTSSIEYSLGDFFKQLSAFLNESTNHNFLEGLRLQYDNYRGK